MKNIPTPHIECADPALIASTVLFPGDPLRAQYIAETYLHDTVCFNRVRGMLGFTGFYGHKRVSVMGSGMGIPSAMLYAEELFGFYGVERIIRIGTAGALSPKVKFGDIVIAMAACTTSSINRTRFMGYDFAPTADFALVKDAYDTAQRMGLNAHVGSVLSADEFYGHDEGMEARYGEYGVLAIEMEAAGIFTAAAKYKKSALAICTVSDDGFSGQKADIEQRRTGYGAMIELALNVAR